MGLNKSPISIFFSRISLTSILSTFKSIPMKKLMVSLRSKNHKIFDSIVVSNLIDMMHNFFGLKVSADMFLHYQPVLRNVQFILLRMVRGIFVNVSVASPKEYNFKVIATFFRTKLSSSSFNSMWLHEKFFSTFQARLSNAVGIGFSHTSPRTPFLIFMGTDKLFITLRANLFILASHIYFMVEKLILSFYRISEFNTRAI